MAHNGSTPGAPANSESRAGCPGVGPSWASLLLTAPASGPGAQETEQTLLPALPTQARPAVHKCRCRTFRQVAGNAGAPDRCHQGCFAWGRTADARCPRCLFTVAAESSNPAAPCARDLSKPLPTPCEVLQPRWSSVSCGRGFLVRPGVPPHPEPFLLQGGRLPFQTSHPLLSAGSDAHLPPRFRTHPGRVFVSSTSHRWQVTRL